MPPKDDPETAALKKELIDLIAKFQVEISHFSLKILRFHRNELFSIVGGTKESSGLYNWRQMW